MPGPVIPTLRYHDARKAIDFLVNAFGFARKMVVEGEGDVIEHAELTFGDSMIMLGSVRDVATEYGTLVATVRETGKPTAGLYVVVDDAEAHMERAREAGAEIVIDLVEQDYGGRDYTCRDPEGNLWTFGTYDPWADTG